MTGDSVLSEMRPDPGEQFYAANESGYPRNRYMYCKGCGRMGYYHGSGYCGSCREEMR